MVSWITGGFNDRPIGMHKQDPVKFSFSLFLSPLSSSPHSMCILQPLFRGAPATLLELYYVGCLVDWLTPAQNVACLMLGIFFESSVALSFGDWELNSERKERPTVFFYFSFRLFSFLCLLFSLLSHHTVSCQLPKISPCLAFSHLFGGARSLPLCIGCALACTGFPMGLH